MTTVDIEKLKAVFPESITTLPPFRGETAIEVAANHWRDVALALRDDADLQFDLLVDIYGVDRLNLGQSPRLAANYELYSTAKNTFLRVIAPALAPDPANGALPALPSVTDLWPTADWLERETYDLMGIEFSGHPWLRRIMLPAEWVGHPLRKDYPLGGEPVYFSRDHDEPRFAHLGQQIMDAPSFLSELPPGMDSETHMVVNMGPQHPATHGVLRIAVELDGEIVVKAVPDTGYLHSGFEKTGENKRYEKFIPYCDRLDYLAPMCNNLAYVLAVEKLFDAAIPEYAQYVRVILAELQRIASHLVWLGTHAMDISGTMHSLLMYAFTVRERILDLFEMVCGARMTTSYFSVGGLRWPPPGAFTDAVKAILRDVTDVLKDTDGMLTANPLWISRTKGIGCLLAKEAIALGVTGPLLRAAGVPLDLRKLKPYSGYDQFDFDIPTATEGDCYARYVVRMAEMRQSVRIVEQALPKLKPGNPYRTADRKVALPPREEIGSNMESLIHHFKLVTEGYKPPPGQIYLLAENPKGWLGFGLISDGTAIPHRLRVRGPSFVNLQATDTMARGGYVSDLIAVIGSIDIVLGEVDR